MQLKNQEKNCLLQEKGAVPIRQRYLLTVPNNTRQYATFMLHNGKYIKEAKKNLEAVFVRRKLLAVSDQPILAKTLASGVHTVAPKN